MKQGTQLCIPLETKMATA